MPAPIRNLNAHPQTVVQSGLSKSVIRIDFDRSVFNTSPDDYFFLYKYEIPEAGFDAAVYTDKGGGMLHFLADDLLVGEGLYVDGFDSGILPNKMDITSNIVNGAYYLIDKDIRPGYAYVYEFIYRYYGMHYTISDVASLSEIEFTNTAAPDQLSPLCMRRRNFTFRNAFPTRKFNNARQEIKEDITLLESDITTLTSTIQDATLYDDYFAKVYALEDGITFLSSMLAFGYGIGAYGKKGGYGF